MSDAEEEPEEDEETQRDDPRDRRLPTMGGRRDLEMDVIGWLLFIGLLILLIPLLPAVILGIILAKLFGFTGDERLSWPRPWA